MKQLEHIETFDYSFTVFSEQKRTPSDLLNTALTYINHENFSVKTLNIYEVPAIATLNIIPQKKQNMRPVSRWRKFKTYLPFKDSNILFSVKVTAFDGTHQKFSVQYNINDLETSASKTKKTEIENITMIETFLSDMFSAIPSTSLYSNHI